MAQIGPCSLLVEVARWLDGTSQLIQLAITKACRLCTGVPRGVPAANGPS